MYRVTEKQVEFGNWKRGILYEPSDIEKKPRIAVLCYYMQIASVTELTAFIAFSLSILYILFHNYG